MYRAAKAWLKKGAGVRQYRYNGKELNEDFGLDWHDYGARWYDASIGRFGAIDRFAEKYSSMTPYQYGANNPISNIDINGDSLYAVFQNREALNAFTQVVNNGLEGQFEVKYRKDGLVTFQATEGGGDVSKLSEHGKAFYEENSKILNAEGRTNIKVAYARSDVHTGKIENSTIDMADVLQFNADPSELGGTQIGKLTHEIVEQGHAQRGTGKIVGDPHIAWQNHHPTAVAAENNVNNSSRSDPSIYSSANAYQDYTRGNKTVRTTILLKENYGLFGMFMRNRRIISVSNKPLK